MSYIEVPAVDIYAFLSSKGFSRYDNKFGNEVVYCRRNSQNSYLLVKVYTSVRDGAYQARGKGFDAIRVVVAYESPERNHGIISLPHVKRSGTVQAVLGRINDRIQEAYVIGTKWLQNNS